MGLLPSRSIEPDGFYEQTMFNDWNRLTVHFYELKESTGFFVEGGKPEFKTQKIPFVFIPKDTSLFVKLVCTDYDCCAQIQCQEWKKQWKPEPQPQCWGLSVIPVSTFAEIELDHTKSAHFTKILVEDGSNEIKIYYILVIIADSLESANKFISSRESELKDLLKRAENFVVDYNKPLPCQRLFQPNFTAKLMLIKN